MSDVRDLVESVVAAVVVLLRKNLTTALERMGEEPRASDSSSD